MSSKSDYLSIASVEMPEEIIEAATSDSLAIFAGAGVSMQPPESLGSFEELTNALFNSIDVTNQVAADEDQPCEARLEKLVDVYGDKVYDECADLMNRNRPSDLHRNILRCFDGHPIRIVTTNFDEKFESAAGELGLALEEDHSIYYSPALPDGDQFAGLVHLHGAVCRPHEMILTETDFGKAYITKARAARFLVDLFSTYTVLFVGYSLNDILVRYLARSIPPTSKNHLFVLAKDNEGTEGIKSLGMTPILFHEFDELPEIFSCISRRISCRLYDKMNTVKGVASQPDQSSPAEWKDAVRFLNDPSEDAQRVIADAYVEGASGFEAVRALVKHGIDGFLFADSPTKQDSVLAQWAAATFALTEPLSLLQLSTEQNKRFSSSFMAQVLGALSNPSVGLDNRMYENSLGIWALQLDLLEPQNPGAGYCITKILERCTSPQISIAYIRKLFEARPSVRMNTLDKKPGPLELAFTYDRFIPELAEYEDSVIRLFRPTPMQGLSIFVNLLEGFHDLLSAYGTIDRPIDLLSLDRAAIEEHEQNSKGEGSAPDSLVDIARDIGLNVINTEDADKAIQLCLGSRSEMAQRIGIFLLLRHNPSPNDAINTVVSRKLLDKIALRHEAFRLLYSVYPRADAEHRSALISYVLKVYPDLADRNDAYGRFNIFSWLEQAAPGDQLLQMRIQEVLAVHPGFKPREHPDLLTYTIVETSSELQSDLPESAFTAENIINSYAEARATGGAFAVDLEFDRFREAMRHYPIQGFAIIEDLAARTDVPPVLIKTLIDSIRWDKLDGNSAARALDLVLLISDDRELFLQALNSLELLFSDDAVNHDVPADRYLKLLDACANHWDWLRDECNLSEKSYGFRDWMEHSLNLPVYVPMELYSIVSEAFLHQSNLPQLQERTSDFVEKVRSAIEEDSCFGHCICCCIGSALDIWLNVSPKIATTYREVLSERHCNSTAAWDGISYTRRLTSGLWSYIKDSLIDWVEHHGGQCTMRLIRLLTIGAIRQESIPERKRIVTVCANLSPQAAAACLRDLTTWIEALSDADQQTELDEWLRALLPCFAEQPQFRACANVIVSWLESESALKKSAFEMLIEHYDDECEELRFPRVDLTRLELEGDSMAKILIFFLKNSDIYALRRMHAQEAVQQIHPSAISRNLFNDLRDQILRQQLELPVDWNCS
ncbi:MAG: SIR2 family protein [Atopobiaceae bacterium]|nr:SIR2 family protein [Atopobiaceae bacterium]